MNYTVMTNQDTSALDSLFDDDGFCRPLPAKVLREIPRDAFRIWCGRNAIYSYPSMELVDYLKGLIGDRKAIEVGAGNGHLGHALGIQMTDSAMQVDPVIKLYYESLGQAVTDPPECVDRIGAEAAVFKYKPEIVIASWVTHRFEPGMKTGNQFGPDESIIVNNTGLYVHIGNDSVHVEKPIWVLDNIKTYHPWLVSRAADESGSHIAIWGIYRFFQNLAGSSMNDS